jgi:transcriptional regulator with XRE-family HTH domain
VEFGKRLASMREDAGLSQSALARRVGTSQSAISQIESGERNPSFETIRQIADALGVTPAYLVGADVEGLAPNEEIHFRLYRSLPTEAREELEQFAAYLRQKHRDKSG